MNRQELLQKLELVTPALSKNKVLPLLQNYLFLHDRIVADNGTIAISTELDSGFAGALPASLVDLLSASKADTVEFLPDTNKNTLLIKAASSKLKLPYQDVNIEKFVVPDLDQPLPVHIEDLVDAMSCCMLSMSKASAELPDALGMTMVGHPNGLNLFATDNSTITHTRVWFKNSAEFRVVVPFLFCKQMLKMAKLDGDKGFEIGDDYALFSVGCNRLFGRCLNIKRPQDFEATILGIIHSTKDMIAVPEKLKLILDRAIVLGAPMEITIEKGEVHFFTKSDAGEVRDHMQLEEPHPDAYLRVDPKLFKAGFKQLNRMLITESALAMSNDNDDLYLVAASE